MKKEKREMLDLFLVRLWEATVFTFKFLGWIIRATLGLITFVSNRRQNNPVATTTQADLFENQPRSK